MKKNLLMLSTLSLITILSFTGCSSSNNNKISRNDAISILDSIKSERDSKDYLIGDDSFVVAKDYGHKKSYYINKVNGVNFDVNTGEMSIDATTSENTTGSKIVSTSYRYSQKHKYVSLTEYLDNGTPDDESDDETLNIIYSVSQKEEDAADCLYVYITRGTYQIDDKGRLALSYTKEYAKYETNYQERFDSYKELIKGKGNNLLASYSDITTSKDYFLSLPTKLSEGNNEEYRSTGKGDVYLRATGNDGTSVVDKFNLNGVQDNYFTHFKDYRCISSYAETKSISEKAVNETLDSAGGKLKYYPISEGSVTFNVDNGDDGTLEYKDDGEGHIVDSEGKEVQNSYIDYLSGEYYISSTKVNCKVSYSYQTTELYYDRYGFAMTDFLPTDASENPNKDNSAWTKVDNDKVNEYLVKVSD